MQRIRAQSFVPIQEFIRLLFVLVAAQYKQDRRGRNIPVNSLSSTNNFVTSE
jgi:hypothetical protein